MYSSSNSGHSIDYIKGIHGKILCEQQREMRESSISNDSLLAAIFKQILAMTWWQKSHIQGDHNYSPDSLYLSKILLL